MGRTSLASKKIHHVNWSSILTNHRCTGNKHWLKGYLVGILQSSYTATEETKKKDIPIRGNFLQEFEEVSFIVLEN